MRLRKQREGQALVFPFIDEQINLPSTRYQGSKAKLTPWIWSQISKLDFESALDIFGGTGVVSYYLKRKGKLVCYNDYLKSNYYTGLGLIENNRITLTSEDLEFILGKQVGWSYKHFISETFKDIYYTEEENEWLDMVVQNISTFRNIYKRALAYYALFQACLVKRPFNLFHRKNLYIRMNDVERSFGNKATWDTPFENHFRSFVKEVNNLVFDNGKNNKAFNFDALDIEGDFDLVYVDPPYTSAKGVSVDYLDFYHFLEGLVKYDRWKYLINHKTKHLSFYRQPNPWNYRKQIRDALRTLFERFKESIIVVSYRSDGIPSIDEIASDLTALDKKVTISTFDNYKYVLSNGRTSEVLIIAE